MYENHECELLVHTPNGAECEGNEGSVTNQNVDGNGKRRELKRTRRGSELKMMEGSDDG